jgi:phenylalanyl-tRNA synthetase beta subunit
MKVLKSWLQDFVQEPLPSAREIAEQLTMRAFEIEGVEELQGGDAVIDADILPNRAHDCLSQQGIAREVATLFDLTFKLPETPYETDKELSSNDLVHLDVPAGVLVPRATKRVIQNIKIGPSPEWMVARLKALGQRSINNVVDITNYVMWETGQPIHAFDYDKIKTVDGKKKITIRKAQEGEKITTLDGQEFTLSTETLVIADDESALDIAGVKGGAHSGIDENTTTIILSACSFDPVAIRKTSRGLGLITDASKRFEQGMTPELVTRAIDRASQLFAELAGGVVAHDYVDVYPRKRNPYLFGVSTDEVNRVLGTAFTDNDVENILQRLGFAFEKVHPLEYILELSKKFVDTPYRYGASVSYDAPKEFDCSSFISYIFMHAGIQIPRDSIDQFLYAEPIEEKELQPGDLIFGKGGKPHITEAVPQGIGHVGLYLGDGNVTHASGDPDNKVIIEAYARAPKFTGDMFRGFGRIPKLADERFVVTIPDERLDIRIPEDLIEEIGRVYGYNNISGALLPQLQPELNKLFYYTNKIRDILVGEGFSEIMTYTFGEHGDVELQNPSAEDKSWLRENLGHGLAVAWNKTYEYKPLIGVSEAKLFEIGTVFPSGREHVQLGLATDSEKEIKRVVAKIEEVLGVPANASVMPHVGIIDLTMYLKKLPEPTAYDLEQIDTKGKMFKPFSSYPFVLRDIAVWAPQAVASLEVEKLIRNNAGDLLVRLGLFDTFSKDGRTSYAYHLIFQSFEKTLSDADVNPIMQKITDDLNARENWQVR